MWGNSKQDTIRRLYHLQTAPVILAGPTLALLATWHDRVGIGPIPANQACPLDGLYMKHILNVYKP